MSVIDPFATLGLTPAATLDDLRAARRRLARELHPDRLVAAQATQRDIAGQRLADINRAYDVAVQVVAARAAPPAAPKVRMSGAYTEVASFVVAAAPEETFEALCVVASWVGEALDSDPPWLLEVHLDAPECFCRLELLPEGTATMVSVTVSNSTTEAVRDLFVAELNRLGEGPLS